MPPKQIYVERGLGSGKRLQPKGYFASTYDTLTSPENSSMVKAIAAFGVGYHRLQMPSIAHMY